MACLDEDTIVAFGEGRLGADAIVRLEDHVASCAPCRDLLVAALGAGTLGAVVGGEPVARGSLVGRYTILALSGRGGMGEVYAAYDQELDRKVALKLLHASAEGTDDGRAKGRLLREAKAMARLSHENVVSVHDAGTFGGRVFVAMEFVDGITLKEWLAAAPRTQREILHVFTLAGRGLEAAHAAGLVHRDFKPHNVMIAADGSVRVMDFGLARSTGDDDAPSSEAEGAAAAAPAAPLHLTRTGELLGTPLYMAPEQFRTERTDARSDQFSFCVALYQALYGAPPFGDTTLKQLMADVLAGRVQRPPAKSAVPGWLRRVLLRGLSVDRDARWPSMSALLAALAADPASARRKAGLAVCVGALVALAGVTVVRRSGTSATLCQAGPERLATAWTSAAAASRRQAVQRAFLASGTPGADQIWVRVAAVLDKYAGNWLGSYREACEATHVRQEQPAAMLDLRMSCLDQKRTSLAALADVFATADRSVVSNAIGAANALPPLAACADLKALSADVEAPRDAATRAKVDDIRKRAATVKALTDSGKTTPAHAQARGLLKEARAAGYRPLVAETLLLFSNSVGTVFFNEEVARVTEEAVWESVAVRRDDIASEAAGRLAWGMGYYLARRPEGQYWLSLTDALLDRAGPGHELLRIWRLQAEATIDLRQDEGAKALELTREANVLRRKILPPDHPDLAIGMLNEAEALHVVGRNDEAQRLAERAQIGLERAYGPGSFASTVNLANRGEYLVAAGQPAEAERLLPRALTAWEVHVGPEDHALGYPLTALGRARLALGRPKDALAPLERAYRLREAGEPEKTLLGETRFALARALWESGADRGRAGSLALAARDAYRQAGTEAKSLAAVDAWLNAHSSAARLRRAERASGVRDPLRVPN